MIEAPRTIRLGTRGTALACWQTNHVAGLLGAAYPRLDVEVVIITTRGDQVLDTPLPLVGGKGLFTAELEAALCSGEIDFAVHSLKDLPTEDPKGLTVGAIPRRADANDVLVSRAGEPLERLPRKATVGTSSRRRAAQLLYHRPDLRTADIRGNVDTRIRKALDPDGPYDAIILAQAGLERMGRLGAVSQVLPLDIMLPAPGQGALAVQCRDEAEALALLSPIEHREARLAVTAERAFLTGLGGGCAVPIAAYASIEGEIIDLEGRVSALDGSRQVDVSLAGSLAHVDNIDMGMAYQLGERLAQMALEQGAKEILEAVP